MTRARLERDAAITKMRTWPLRYDHPKYYTGMSDALMITTEEAARPWEEKP